MSISLTLEQALERLSQPQRLTLMKLAIDEDVKSIMPLQFQVNDDEGNSLKMKEALGKLAEKLFLRSIQLAFDETLD